MKPELQHIAIAAAVGLERQPDADMPDCYVYADVAYPLDEWPDFTGCLNAMHEAEKVLESHDNHDGFGASSLEVYLSLIHKRSSAAKRAEAFLRAIGKWQPTADASSTERLG